MPEPSNSALTPRSKRQPLTFVTASGKKVTPKAGERVKLDDSAPRLVDIAVVFDTTGSMDDKISGLVACMVSFVEELAQLRLDWRFTVVPFGDLTVPGDRIVSDLPFVSEQTAAQDLVRSMPRF